MANNDTGIGKQVGSQLKYAPSKQPVANTQKVGDKPKDANKVRSSAGMAFTRMVQKGNPNRSYPVEVIDKAKARIG